MNVRLQERFSDLPLSSKYTTLRLVFGDQLNASHTWFKQCDDNVLYVIAELKQEATYVKHHIQKVCAFFLAMEAFAHAMRQVGHHFVHLTLDDTEVFATLDNMLVELVSQFAIEHVAYQRPDEYRLLDTCRRWALFPSMKNITFHEVDTEHFLLPYAEISGAIHAGKHNRMETFYRKMRKRFNILLENDQPVGGRWNYDQDNREKLKPKNFDFIPKPLLFANDASSVIERLKNHGIPTIGDAQGTLIWPINRQQSLKLLQYFCDKCLPCFGRFQDAMVFQHDYQWSLFHSRLSFALNAKMLHPMQVIDAAIEAYEQSEAAINLAQVEGFIRQILGWREYVRAVYWQNMPGYAQLNALDAEQNLPSYFWNGETRMACMQKAIGQSLEFAYAHHIQRLMITGNFCLLTGIQPSQVDEWYLGIYIDAIEWVEMPNTRGMSQFSDGGFVATKPYAASGNYINKMSDYCKSCTYQVKQRVGKDACPFNSLYWHFIHRHRALLEKNPRIGMVYRTWEKMPAQEKKHILARANECLENLEQL